MGVYVCERVREVVSALLGAGQGQQGKDILLCRARRYPSRQSSEVVLS